MSDEPTNPNTYGTAQDAQEYFEHERRRRDSVEGLREYIAQLEAGDGDPAPPIEGLTLQQMPLRWSRRRGKLAAALAAAQADIKPVGKDRTNEFLSSSYASTNAIREAGRIPLAKHGIAVVQGPYVDERRVTVLTQLVHESEQWVECEVTFVSEYIKGLNPMQTLGVAMSYARRYTLQMITGATVIEDEDDNDGNDRAEGAAGERKAAPPPAPKVEQPTSAAEFLDVIGKYDEAQLAELRRMIPFFKFALSADEKADANNRFVARLKHLRGEAPEKSTKAGKLADDLKAKREGKAAATPKPNIHCVECKADIEINGLVIDETAIKLPAPATGMICGRCASMADGGAA